MADQAPTINPSGGSVNTTAFDELYSGSVFDQDQKDAMLKRYKKCVKKADKYMEDNGAKFWNTWQERQTDPE